jgi:hypothetical protein
MQRLILALLVLTAGLFAQNGNTIMRDFAGVPSGTCSMPMLARNAATGNLYNCTAAGTWNIVGTTPSGGAVGGASSLTTVGAVPKVTAAGVLGEAAASTNLIDTNQIMRSTLPLGLPAGSTTSWITAINSSGVMVGAATIGGVYHPIKWASDGTPTDLGLPAGSTASYIKSINSSGVMVGIATIGGVLHPFKWAADGTPTDLGLPAGSTEASIRGINASGVMVGVATIGGVNHPMKWASDGTPTDLGLPAGSTEASIDEINSSGVMVGFAKIGGVYHPMKWASDGTPTDLGLPSGSTTSYIKSINASGIMVGYAMIGGVLHPIKWAADGTPTDLSLVGIPADTNECYIRAINESGVMAGSCYKSDWSISHAAMWLPDGTRVDLGRFGSEVVDMFDINDAGIIVGERTDAAYSVEYPLVIPNALASLPTASAIQNGVLKQTDWSTFNGKVGGASSLTTVGVVPRVTAAGVLGAGNIFDSGTAVGVGTTSPDRLFHAELADAGTNAVAYTSRQSHITSGIATTGFGAGSEVELENASGTNRVASTVETSWVTATDSAETAKIVWKTMTAGAAAFELMSVSSTGLNAPAGGTVPACSTTTVAYTNAAFKAAATTADVTLFALPARGKLTGVTIKHTVAYAGTAVSSTTVSVGNGASTYDQYASAYDIFQAVADTTFQDTVQFKSTTMAASDVKARFTANTNFGDGSATVLTAGSVGISACWVVLP